MRALSPINAACSFNCLVFFFSSELKLITTFCSIVFSSFYFFYAVQTPNCEAANSSHSFHPYLISLEYSFSMSSLLLNFQLKMAMYTSRMKVSSREPTVVPVITANLFGTRKVQIHNVILASCVYCQEKKSKLRKNKKSIASSTTHCQ